MSLKTKTDEFANKYGLIYGFGSAEPFYEYEGALGKAVPFVGFSLEQRLKPQLTLPEARGLIALGLSYNYKYEMPTDDDLYARLSQGAVGEDYHLIMTRLLRELGELLFKGTEHKYMCFCDTGPLSDALVALRCGLGFNGLNHSVISDKFGSMFFIGYILTTAELEPTPKPQSKCNGCGLCVRGCPSGALNADGSFTAEKCVAYLTQQKGIIPDELKGAMDNLIYGCDRCRQVCPLTPKPQSKQGCAYPKISELLGLTNKEFNSLYGNTAIGWRGKRTIIRNALIALGNIGGKRSAELAKPFLQSEFEDLKDAAQWAVKHRGE
jgi:epoxyqueuosine reductase